MTDAELLLKIKAGNLDAFKELLDQYKQQVINTCYRFLLNKEDAEDISQEVFIEIYQSVHSFRGESKLSTWIYRVAVTKCLDEIKKRKRKKRIRSIGKMLRLEEVAEWLSGGSAADTNMLEKEQMKEMMIALDKLPDNQRVAFTLSKLEGYSNKEIADIMGTTTVMVESFISRGKKKVFEELKNILNKNQG